MSNEPNAPALVAITAVVTSLITLVGNWIVAAANRKPAQATLGDGIREDALYWQQRAQAADKRNDELYALLQESHQREERVLRVNDAVMSTSSAVRAEVERHAGPGDALELQG